jgi:acetyl-CoA carboxylase carboxyltransferase component
MNMRELVADLEARRARVHAMGGPEKVAKQHERGKLTARERLAALYDDGLFFEVGACVASARSTGAWSARRRTISR